MINFYVNMIKQGLKTIEEVPESIRPLVSAALKQNQ